MPQARPISPKTKKTMIRLPNLEPLDLRPAPIFLLNDNPVPGKPALTLQTRSAPSNSKSAPAKPHARVAFPKFSRAPPPSDIAFLKRNPIGIFLKQTCSGIPNERKKKFFSAFGARNLVCTHRNEIVCQTCKILRISKPRRKILSRCCVVKANVRERRRTSDIVAILLRSSSRRRPICLQAYEKK